MTVYNGERFLRESIESILNQTFRDYEFIIVNDGSTDSTKSMLLSYSDPRIKILENDQNIGQAESSNRGLALARGTYIARQDADDVSHPERLARQLESMHANPSVAVLGTQVAYIDERGRNLKPWDIGKPTSPLGAKYALLFGIPANHPTVMYRKKIIWDEFKGYNRIYTVSDDAELLCRVGLKYLIQNLPDVLVKYRIHPSSNSCDTNHPRRATHLELWRKRRHEVIKKILERDDVPREWGEWWELVQNHSPIFIGSEKSLALLGGINNIEEIFFEKFPMAADNSEITEITASVKLRLALYAIPFSRNVSRVALFSAFRSSTRVGIACLPKYSGYFFLGGRAKRLYRYIFNLWPSGRKNSC